MGRLFFVQILGDPCLKPRRKPTIKTFRGGHPACFLSVSSHLPPDGFPSPAHAAGVFFARNFY